MEFAGLHQLLVPCLPQLDDLPPPQRDALRVAFGQETGPPPEQFLVGLAALTLLSRAAEAQPLLCIVDDAHWLDPESAQVLGFVARRLCADRVGFIASVGEPAVQPVFEQLPAITVDGLPDAEARELLCSVAGGVLSAQAVDRILADTRNNPLALVELGTQYTADQLSSRAVQPERFRWASGSRTISCARYAACRQTPRRSRCWPRPTRQVTRAPCGAGRPGRH